jgi:micrococcal nuclease
MRIVFAIKNNVPNITATLVFGFLFLLIVGVIGPEKSAVTEFNPKFTLIQSKSYPTVISAKVTDIYVTDGDTIRHDEETYRLMGFDTPETFRSRCAAELKFGLEAKEYLLQRLRNGKELQLHWKGMDKYRRRLAVLTIDGVDIAADMIEAGLAVEYHGKGKRINWCDRQNTKTPE